MALAMTCLWTTTHAQVGINTITPDAGSILEIDAEDKGVLIPRVNIADLTNIAPVTGSSTESLLVYNTNTTTGKGFYYWSGTNWVAVGSERGWGLNGNAGTNPANNFVGTTDAQALQLRTNDTERMRINANGNVGINQTSPTERLHVNGNFRLQGAFMPNNQAGNTGQVLVSAGASNNPTWGANLSNVSGITRYNTVEQTLNRNSTYYVVVPITGITTESTAIVTFLGNLPANTYDDLTIHYVEMRDNEVRICVSNNTGFLGGGTDYTVRFNITIIR